MFSCPKTALTGDHPLNTDSQKQPDPSGEVPRGPVTKAKTGSWHWTGSKAFQESCQRGVPAPGVPGDSRTHLPTTSGGQFQMKDGHMSCTVKDSGVLGNEDAFTPLGSGHLVFGPGSQHPCVQM